MSGLKWWARPIVKAIAMYRRLSGSATAGAGLLMLVFRHGVKR